MSRGLPACDEATSHAILNRYVELGGNFIDTADVYGESEKCIGTWLKTKTPEFRDSLVIATKFRSQTGTGLNDGGASRKHIHDSLNRSLKALNTSYVDLYQLHRDDPSVPPSALVRMMTDLVRAGLIRYWGVSNVPAYRLQKMLDYAKSKGLERPISNQAQYSLMCRSIEWEQVPQAKSENVAILPWSPLAGGWLSGKIKRGTTTAPESSRVAWAEAVGWRATDFKSNAQEQTFAIIEEVYKVAEELHTTPAAVSLRYLLQKQGVTSVIIGARTLDQFNDNVSATWITLTDDHIKRLDKVSDTPLPYPFGMLAAALGR